MIRSQMVYVDWHAAWLIWNAQKRTDAALARKRAEDRARLLEFIQATNTPAEDS
jgi:hypothetical protein